MAFCILSGSLCPLCLCGELPAPPLVVPVDGGAFAAELVSIDAAGQLTFRPAAEAASPGREFPVEGEIASAVGPRSLSRDDLVRWSHPPLPRPQTLVLLDDGSRLVTAADWSGGAAVRLEGQTFLVRSDTFGEVRLPKSRVRGLVFANRRHVSDRQRLEDAVRASAEQQDQVWLTNQDRLAGEILELPGGSLTLATEVGDAKLPLSRIEAIVFGERGAGSGEQGVRSGSRSLLVALRDGSLLHAARVEADSTQLDVRLAGMTRLAGGTVDDVASLQSMGGRFAYLSDLEPADYRHVPYLDVPWPYHRDRSVAGTLRVPSAANGNGTRSVPATPLSVDGNRYWKGLGMHSAARLTYRLEAPYRRFDAEVAVDDWGGAGSASAGRSGSVVFGVYVLRDGKWQAAFTSDVVRGGDAPQAVSVDVAGAQGLTLTVDYADRGDELDYANWLDARLVR